MCFMQFTDILASSKRSGSSLESFSRATSAIGPNITTGLRKPAAQREKKPLTDLKNCAVTLKRVNRHVKTPHPLSAQLFHKLETLFGLAVKKDPLGSSSGSSLNCEDHGTSRSQPCLHLLFWGECIAHWRAALLCRQKQRYCH